MKSVPKLIGRFIGILFMSLLLLIILNVLVLSFISVKQLSNSSPYQTAEEIAVSLQKKDSGFKLDSNNQKWLQTNNIWAILIDEDTKTVTWQTDDLPETIPKSYSLSAISSLTSGYIDGYPTYTGASEGGIVVLGYPKKSYWKHIWPSWDYQFIADLPQTVFIVLIANLLLIVLIYYWVTSKLTKSIAPIVQGIQGLVTKNNVYVKEKGPLSELAMNINQTSQTLQSQERVLKKRETARANWIAGVSHDIRTPLSMVMGYAGQLESNPSLSLDEQHKVNIILRQSEKMKNLIKDLNLASKLEYNMQPINMEKINVAVLTRQVVVDFLNIKLDKDFPIKFERRNNVHSSFVLADEGLMKRAITNLIQNAISHNEKGCHIFISVFTKQESCIVVVEDDGIGISDKQIEELNNAPHYMISDQSTMEQRHGLGLLLVKQITLSHNGEMKIGHSCYGGFSVTLEFPINNVN